MFSAILKPAAARMQQARQKNATSEYRYESLLTGHRNNGVVAVGPPSGWVNENVNVLVEDRDGARLPEHNINVLGLKGLLERVKGKPGELGLDEVGPVLHDGLELHVAVGALPPAQQADTQSKSRSKKKDRKKKRKQSAQQAEAPGKPQDHKPGNQVQHVDAIGGLALRLASGTSELDTQKGENWQACELVPHLHEPSVEVDLAGERADGQERGSAHNHERRDGLLPSSTPKKDHVNDKRERRDSLMSSSSNEDMAELPEWASAHVKESWVDVGSLLEDNDVSSGALSGRDLPSEHEYKPKSHSEKAQIERLLAAMRII